MAKEALSPIKETFIDRILRYWRTSKARKYLGKNKIICDLGCGYDGIFLKNNRKHFFKGIGFDVHVSRGSDGVELIKASVDKEIILPDGFADVVVSFAVLEHIKNYKKFFSEAYRITKPGGFFIVTTPDLKAKNIWEMLMKLKMIKQSEDIEEHEKYFHPDEARALFEETGFKNIEHKKFQFGFNNLFIAKK